MKIGLYTNTPRHINGCHKVVKNLTKGLDQLGIEWVENEEADYNGCIHGAVREFNNKTLPPNTLIGPEIMVLPSDMPQYWNRYRHWCQPSQWVIDYMQTFKECKNNRFYVWPVGIDTDEFKHNRGKIEQDCFIYYKNVTKQTPEQKLHYVRRELENRKLSYKVLEYGKYKEDELKHLASTSKFCISLVGTESQGIGIMEIMSIGCPVYVIDEKQFKYNDYTFNGHNVSSTPYFSDECGMIVSDMSKMDLFLSNVSNYNPSNYIMNNHTCKHGAQKYVDILRRVNERN
jgi:hypothetical protein